MISKAIHTSSVSGIRIQDHSFSCGKLVLVAAFMYYFTFVRLTLIDVAALQHKGIFQDFVSLIQITHNKNFQSQTKGLNLTIIPTTHIIELG